MISLVSLAFKLISMIVIESDPIPKSLNVLLLQLNSTLPQVKKSFILDKISLNAIYQRTGGETLYKVYSCLSWKSAKYLYKSIEIIRNDPLILCFKKPYVMNYKMLTNAFTLKKNSGLLSRHEIWHTLYRNTCFG